MASKQIKKVSFWDIRDTLASYIHHHDIGHEYTKSELSKLLLENGLVSNKKLANQAFSSLFSSFCEESRPLLLFSKDKRIIRTEQVPTYSD